eukprot:CAMPEP_0171065510 /NCGR_PEP_ID=MMETSP0766_2-20121228/6886_1 /TAXON_ID=439317 /ORGANISM="Gambierdiscus australes, Strain CAWD 149" /LENGTH=104 /DNA_ID=CAMNT_0011521617 /DNA_START=289 /DNA_END=600 /DNA_ORIENTATION=-
MTLGDINGTASLWLASVTSMGVGGGTRGGPSAAGVKGSTTGTCCRGESNSFLELGASGTEAASDKSTEATMGPQGRAPAAWPRAPLQVSRSSLRNSAGLEADRA